MDSVKIYLISDKLENINILHEISVLDFNGKTLSRQLIPVVLKLNHSEIAAIFLMTQLISDNNKSRVLLLCRLNKGNTKIAENFSYFKSPKDLDLKQPKIKKHFTRIASGFFVELSTNTLAKNVYLVCSDTDAFFSDNYFDLIPGIPKTVTLKIQIQQEEFERSMKLISLVDSYRE